jgi:dsDNA-specific endonuclease/ATPase MutS2
MFRWLFQSKRRAKDVHVADHTSSSETRDEEPAPEGEPEPVEVPLDGVLDLHTFRKSEIKSLVRDYVNECRAHDVLMLRIIHGKGQGTLRRITHSVLSDMPEAVASFELAEHNRGGWGATVVNLKPLAVPAARSDRHGGDE